MSGEWYEVEFCEGVAGRDQRWRPAPGGRKGVRQWRDPELARRFALHYGGRIVRVRADGSREVVG